MPHKFCKNQTLYQFRCHRSPSHIKLWHRRPFFFFFFFFQQDNSGKGFAPISTRKQKKKVGETPKGWFEFLPMRWGNSKQNWLMTSKSQPGTWASFQMWVEGPGSVIVRNLSKSLGLLFCLVFFFTSKIKTLFCVCLTACKCSEAFNICNRVKTVS